MSWFRKWRSSEKQAEETAGLTQVSTDDPEKPIEGFPTGVPTVDDGEGLAAVADSNREKVVTAADLPQGFTTILAIGSIWKRKPPKKEVVRVGRVWWNDDHWTVRATPVRGGRPIVAEAQWFIDNYDNQETSD